MIARDEAVQHFNERWRSPEIPAMSAGFRLLLMGFRIHRLLPHVTVVSSVEGFDGLTTSWSGDCSLAVIRCVSQCVNTAVLRRSISESGSFAFSMRGSVKLAWLVQ